MILSQRNAAILYHERVRGAGGGRGATYHPYENVTFLVLRMIYNN